MNNMVLPHKVESDAVTRNYGRFIISPLESGYGLTLGTALRRVLLSSLPGAAVTSMRVSDVHHEFSAIPNVREDMTQLILQVKQLRLRLFDTEQARLRLEHRGEGTVTAADIICPPEVEIINTDLYLFTADSPDAHIEMEFEVQAGRGYSQAEERGRLPIGELPIDAIFSPIRRVNFDVDRARVGQRTNYDKLILEIWTDGRITPDDALKQSASILKHHLDVFDRVSDEHYEFESQQSEVSEEQNKLRKLLNMSVNEIELSVRAANCLNNANITTVGELAMKTEQEMLKYRNFGKKSLNEIKEKLEALGLSLGMKFDERLLDTKKDA